MPNLPQSALDCQFLLSVQPFKRASKNKSCAALGRKLGLDKKTVLAISNGAYCGQRTAARLERLRRSPGSRRDRSKDKPRIYVPMADELEAIKVNTNTTAQQRRAALLALADQSAATVPHR